MSLPTTYSADDHSSWETTRDLVEKDMPDFPDPSFWTRRSSIECESEEIFDSTTASPEIHLQNDKSLQLEIFRRLLEGIDWQGLTANSQMEKLSFAAHASILAVEEYDLKQY